MLKEMVLWLQMYSEWLCWREKGKGQMKEQSVKAQQSEHVWLPVLKHRLDVFDSGL